MDVRGGSYFSFRAGVEFSGIIIVVSCVWVVIYGVVFCFFVVFGWGCDGELFILVIRIARMKTLWR